MDICNPVTQRHHLPVCTEQQKPLWILNLNGLIVPPTPICSGQPASHQAANFDPRVISLFSKPIRICLPLKSYCELPWSTNSRFIMSVGGNLCIPQSTKYAHHIAMQCFKSLGLLSIVGSYTTRTSAVQIVGLLDVKCLW